MAGYTCPFCKHTMSLTADTYTHIQPTFTSLDISCYNPKPKETVEIRFYKCPNCEKISIELKGIGSEVKNIFLPVYPNSLAKQFPEYVPPQIRQDYTEAYSIVNLSPKASATLSRRCLQGMIRDFWGITKNNLAAAINELQGKVSPVLWNAIDGIRSIGNIGAHMEKDIDHIIDVEPEEAETLLTLIEMLIDNWYIRRHEEEKLLTKITQTAADKQAQRHPD